MRVGLVRRGFSGSGGAERYLLRFATALVAAGHKCVFFTSEEWPADQWQLGKIHRVPGNSPKRFADALDRIEPKKLCDSLFSFERIWSCDCYRAGDGVHGAWLERLSEYEPRWRTLFRQRQRKHREILDLEKKLFGERAASRVIANSHLVKNELVSRFGYPAEKIEVIYNGAPVPAVNDLLRESTRGGLNIPLAQSVILFGGSGWKRKGLQFAIEAVKTVREFDPILLVAGRGKPGKFPATQRTRFLGPVPDLTPFLAAADMFLLPTIYDPFSNACLEALAAGLPVLTTSSNGFSEIIRPGIDGEVFIRADEIGAMAASIERWSTASAELQSARKSRAAEFSIDANLRATLSVLEDERARSDR